MAIHYGYVSIPHSTYAEWRSNVIGEGYNVDYSWGCQCWDLVAELYFNAGFPQGYPLTGPNNSAYECWTVNRDNNTSYGGTTYFDLIYNLSDVKEGDIVVWNYTSQSPNGHIAFADEDYDGSGQLWCIGQNQGGTILPEGGTVVTRNHLYTSNFLGAFRYREWHTTPPTPTEVKTNKFKWVLYARNLRNKRNNML